jgi:hypothetical protein
VTLQVAESLRPLYDYLAGRGSFVDLDNNKPEHLPILSRDVLRRITDGEDGWEPMVPPEVETMVKQRGFFGYQPDGS